MEHVVDQPCRDRVTVLEAEVKDLKENYAPLLMMERRFNEQASGISRIENAVTRTNDTISMMGRRLDEAVAETNQRLQTLFELDAERMRKIGEFQTQLHNEQVAAIRNESAEKIALMQAEREQLQQQIERGRLLNRLKDWKVIVGFIVAVVGLGASLAAGVMWLVDYGVKNAR